MRLFFYHLEISGLTEEDIIQNEKRLERDIDKILTEKVEKKSSKYKTALSLCKIFIY